MTTNIVLQTSSPHLWQVEPAVQRPARLHHTAVLPFCASCKRRVASVQGRHGCRVTQQRGSASVADKVATHRAMLLKVRLPSN
jgi:hypothetical protein